MSRGRYLKSEGRGSSRNFILGGKLTDHGHGEGRVDFIIITSGNILGGGEVELFGSEVCQNFSGDVGSRKVSIII